MSVTDRARTLPRRVLESIVRQQLWSAGDRVLVAVSGGMDSMVLMHLLSRLCDAHKGELEVASVDHGLRSESAAEVRTVAAAARQLDLKCHTLCLNLDAGPNLGLRAREARQEALLALGHHRIATGHHQDDQAETVLQHLLRGAGMTGLSGMKAASGHFCRPLLSEPKAVLRAWAEAEQITWVEDPSNAASQRGQIRTLMPKLDALHGGASGALARSARLLAHEDALLQKLTDDAWSTVSLGVGLDREALACQHPAIQLRLLRRLIAHVPARVGSDPLEAVLEGALMTPGRLDLGAGWVLILANGRLVVEGPTR